MKSRLLPVLVFTFFIASSICLGASAPVHIAGMKTMAFDKWGFEVEMPKLAERYSMPEQAQAQLSELFVFDGLVYFVRVTPTAADALTPTAIEQRIQSLIKSSSCPDSSREVGTGRGPGRFVQRPQPHSSTEQRLSHGRALHQQSHKGRDRL